MIYKVTLNGKSYEVEVERGEATLLGESDVTAPAAAPASAVAAAPTPAVAPAAALSPSDGEPLGAPMPGTIVSIKVTDNQAVKKGNVILILEAMKMENEVVAPKDATVVRVITTPGATVNAGDPLVLLR